MAEPAPDFLDVLTVWLGVRAGFPRVEEPFALWTHSIEETEGATNVTDPVSVLRIYGGDRGTTSPTRHPTIQCLTRGSNLADAMERAGLLAAKLCDDEGMPVRDIRLTDSPFYMSGVTELLEPGFIGRDSNNRAEVVFNFVANYCVLTDA